MLYPHRLIDSALPASQASKSGENADRWKGPFAVAADSAAMSAALASGLANTRSDSAPRAPRVLRPRKASIALSRNGRLEVLPPQLSTAYVPGPAGIGGGGAGGPATKPV